MICFYLYHRKFEYIVNLAELVYFQMIFVIVTAVLARSFSTANRPSAQRLQQCLEVCGRHFMKCRTSCPKGRHQSVDMCYNKFHKCEAKCHKKFGTPNDPSS